MTQTKLQILFKSQSDQQYAQRLTKAAERIERLKKLKSTIEAYEEQIYAALQSDLRKSRFESAATEILFTYGELDFAIKHLKRWMRPRRVGTTITNLFAKSRVYYEPKGVCLILAPWNYPFQLVMSPLISAIAAGNCAIVKPSEISSETARVISSIIKDAFNPNEVACVEGGPEIATTLLDLPFNHIFFTGSTQTGKLVMAAAAKHLASVTLELGGKSPVIIDDSANLENAAEKIAWGKLVNAGQTCIAPDYLYIPTAKLEKFTELYQAAVQRLFFTSGELDPENYGKIINDKHFARISSLIKDAASKKATVLGGQLNEPDQVISPTVMLNVDPNSKVMQEEIFGPVLPILTYNKIEEVVKKINAQDKPLALYIFSINTKNIDYILSRTSSGGACINDVLVHISNPKLPFGGVNGSGMGSCHGVYGFKAFSHERAVVFQSRLNFTRFIFPPYAGKDWIINLLKKIM